MTSKLKAPRKRHEGMFQPGQSGNPSGRPKAIVSVRDKAREHTDEALEILVDIAKNSLSSDSARVQACNAILDRAWGKPTQHVEALTVGATYSDFLQSIAEQEGLISTVVETDD